MVGRACVLAGVLWAAVAGAAGGKAKAPCPHPYFPISEGLELTYRAGTSEVKVTYSDVSRRDGTLKGVLNVVHKGKHGSTEARCTPEGIVTQLGGIEGAALSMSGMDVKVVSSEGIAMPPPDALVEGASWSNTMALELRPPEGSGLSFGVIRSTFKKDAVVEGTEKIEVAGRTWQALRVRNRITAMAGTAAERTMESIMWLAPEVGILRIQTGDSVDLELLSVRRNGRGAGGAGTGTGAR